MQKIKNLNSIQVFDAAARLKNVTRAAEFLNTSQSSVSYHIKKLEDDIGSKLFERTGNGLALTVQGETLAMHAEQAFGLIQSGLEKIAEHRDHVRVAVLPLFASRWLSSRLGGMWEANPGLQIAFLNHNNNFVRHERPTGFADLGIQWGRGDWDDFQVSRLWNEELVVVCSRDYLKKNPIKDVSSLRDSTLLHVDDKRMWSEFFKSNLVEMAPSQREMLLEDRHFQLNATINGLGVALFSKRMIEPELASGDLVNPFDRSFETSFAYHLVVPKSAVLSPPAQRFKTWLLRICRS